MIIIITVLWKYNQTWEVKLQLISNLQENSSYKTYIFFYFSDGRTTTFAVFLLCFNAQWETANFSYKQIM